MATRELVPWTFCLAGKDALTLAALKSQFLDPPDAFGVNCWYNRVKGDQLHPDRRQHTKTNIRLVGGKGYRNPGLSSSGLSPSGLLGPVEIVSERSDMPTDYGF